MIEPAPTSPSRGGENRATQRKGARATTPTLSVQIRRNCRWHSEAEMAHRAAAALAVVLALRNQAIRHFRSVPKWHQNHDPKVATLCQIVAFFHDDVTSPSRAAGQPGPRAENRERGRGAASAELGGQKGFAHHFAFSRHRENLGISRQMGKMMNADQDSGNVS